MGEVAVRQGTWLCPQKVGGATPHSWQWCQTGTVALAFFLVSPGVAVDSLHVCYVQAAPRRWGVLCAARPTALVLLVLLDLTVLALFSPEWAVKR